MNKKINWKQAMHHMYRGELIYCHKTRFIYKLKNVNTDIESGMITESGQITNLMNKPINSYFKYVWYHKHIKYNTMLQLGDSFEIYRPNIIKLEFTTSISDEWIDLGSSIII